MAKTMLAIILTGLTGTLAIILLPLWLPGFIVVTILKNSTDLID